MNKTIEFNDQQIDFLKRELEEIAENYDNYYSNTSQVIAFQIITKLNEE